MPTPVTVYRWDDVGAPQLNTGKPSEIINVLKKCLVEGYGSKLPLDWSIVFEDNVTKKIVFQNKVAAGGSGGMVRFRSNAGTDGDYALMRFVAAKSFANINSPFQPGYEQAFLQQQPEQKGWVIIGTPKSFYFMIHRVPALTASGSKMSSGTNYGSTIFVGDFESFIPNDAGRFISLNASSNSNTDANFTSSLDYSDAYSTPGNSGSPHLLVMRADGAAFSMKHTISKPLGAGGSSSQTRTFELVPRILVPICISIADVGFGSDLSDTNGGDVNNSLVFPYFRGKLPGFFQGDFSGYCNTDWPVVRAIGSRQMWLIKQAFIGGCTMWIDLESWE